MGYAGRASRMPQLQPSASSLGRGLPELQVAWRSRPRYLGSYPDCQARSPAPLPPPFHWASPGRTGALKAPLWSQGGWAGHLGETNKAAGRTPVSSTWRVSQLCPAGYWPQPAGGVRGPLIPGLRCLHLGCFLARPGELSILQHPRWPQDSSCAQRGTEPRAARELARERQPGHCSSLRP